MIADIKAVKKNNCIVEDCTSLQNEQIRAMANLKIYCDVDDDLRLMWKIMRTPWYKKLVKEPEQDQRTFGGSLPRAFESWTRADKPAGAKYVLPNKEHADIVISYKNWEEFNQELEKVKKLVDLYYQNPQEFKKQLESERQKLNPESKTITKEITKEIQIPAPKQSILKQPSTYLLITSGIVITLLSLGVCQLFKTKFRKNKS